MHQQRVALVTGANQGIGLQIAKELAGHGFTVLVGSRNLERGEVAARSVGNGAMAIQLDVTDDASVTAASARISNEFGRLDVLVNNAAISHLPASETSFEALIAAAKPTVISLDEVRGVFETNVFRVIAVTQAMLPLLRRAPAPRIVNVSSEVGSLTLQRDPNNPHRMANAAYVPSKTALNAITVAFANELEGTPIKVNMACPGFTSTALNNFRGTRTVEQGARQAVRLCLLDDDGPTGTFSNEFGPLPW